jgi:hypothetical protein
LKLHHTTIEELIRIYTTYGGHRSEIRLREELNKVNFIIYEQATGKKVIVTEKSLQEKLNRRN